MKNPIPMLKRASPTILSCIGTIGVIATAVTAVRATPKAMKLCEDLLVEYRRSNDYEEDPTALDYVKVGWKPYIPSIAIGLGTIVCIFGANGLNKQQQASLASAYIFLERSYKEYKDKVKSLLGEQAENQVEESIVQDKFATTAIEKTRDDTCIFYEEHYGKFFERTMLEVREAEYQLNRKLAQDGEVSLNEFFELLGLPQTNEGEVLGWTQEKGYDCYSYSWIDFEHTLTALEGGLECYIIEMPLHPIPYYNLPF